jgi:hypothetical protein
MSWNNIRIWSRVCSTLPPSMPTKRRVLTCEERERERDFFFFFFFRYSNISLSSAERFPLLYLATLPKILKCCYSGNNDVFLFFFFFFFFFFVPSFSAPKSGRKSV